MATKKKIPPIKKTVKKTKGTKPVVALKTKKKAAPVVKKAQGKKQTVVTKIKSRSIWQRPYAITEIFTPGIIGHGAAHPIGDPNHLVVDDYLVDNSGISKGGESVNPFIQIGLNGVNKMIFSVRPEAGKTLFTVTRPAGINKGAFTISFSRRALHPAAGGNVTHIYIPVITFTNLTGTAPLITYSAFMITTLNNNLFKVFIEGEFTSDFSFSEIKVTCAFPVRNLLPVVDLYKLISDNRPFTLPGVNDANYISFGYYAPNLIDLGPIITLS